MDKIYAKGDIKSHFSNETVYAREGDELKFIFESGVVLILENLETGVIFATRAHNISNIGKAKIEIEKKPEPPPKFIQFEPREQIIPQKKSEAAKPKQVTKVKKPNQGSLW